MKYYLDITLLPDAETSLGFLWHKVYQQVHIALVENKVAKNQSEVAVSFPEYGSKFPLGAKLRLLANTKEKLELLNVGKWLKRLTDYVHCTSIKDVPDTVSSFTCFNRFQVAPNKERIARRRVKRHGGTLDEALAYFENYEEHLSKLPFINMNSLSESKKFKLFVNKIDVSGQCNGDFDCYGLSKVATVPLF
ncbi:type I-F CRISPR-associated endoribonuclease Cas6/Csy4 [Moritella sp. 5]|uniref:type I-F CRISPR-associated endoribonuclease Cas6/Csy4 n=1 Tax=Moritella sp. 5 TaxID=2746231 RepID=UPI001BAB2382|nr:type I-F CRISPR-associated endoribonuclease Cas6/Csy4 [Moritella sp. 5]QUM81128.1 type I-F CRISPR-associated endoribonuclease Cas6/Csy4 [Moritella sp. 5]